VGSVGVLELGGDDGVPGLVKKREGIQRVAKRPRNSSLLVHKWAKLYGNPPWWKDSLRRFVMEREYEEDARKA
jgi:dTDP-4-dehydrorhamnose reductase